MNGRIVASAGALASIGLAAWLALANMPPSPEQVAHDRAVKTCTTARAAHRLVYSLERCVMAEEVANEDDDGEGGPFDNDDGDGDKK